MNKKISVGIIAILMITGAVVYAKSNTNCPDRPGCIYPKEASVKIIKKQAIAKENENCPNRPGCICN